MAAEPASSATFPDLACVALDLGQGGPERRERWPLPWLALRLLDTGERALVNALVALAQADDMEQCNQLCHAALADGVAHPDLLLLAAAGDLAAGCCAAARDLLREVYLHVQDEAADNDADAGTQRPGPRRPHQPVGLAIRRLYPALRLLVRLTPAQLLPVYPSPYAAALLYAVALDACGQPADALAVLREMAGQFGLLDELRIMAARVHLDQGHVDSAYQSLTYGECAAQDALEFTRTLYLAQCLALRGQTRPAAQELGRVVRTIGDVNEQSLWRAQALLAELYASEGLLLDALRQSGASDPAWLPEGAVAATLAREEGWLAQLAALGPVELERLAGADVYQVHLPDPPAAPTTKNRLDISRDPLKQFAPAGMSWAAQQVHAQALAEARAAVARGEAAPVSSTPKLSAAGADIRRRIAAAQAWWPARRDALRQALPQPRLALTDMATAVQLRCDFRGTREPELTPLAAELRAQLVVRWAGSIAALGAALLLARACFGL